jgi:hypothetical protein
MQLDTIAILAARVVLDRGDSTSDALAAAGLDHREPTTKRRGQYQREVITSGGEVVFVGSCYECNDWIRAGMPRVEVSS